MANVQLPSQLASLADGRKSIEVQASTLGEVFREIDELAPMIRSQIFDANNAIRQFVGVFVDEHQVNDLGDGSQPVHGESRIFIVMSVAGG
jgi:molybdopterin synthase sulfur carrier subunit